MRTHRFFACAGIVAVLANVLPPAVLAQTPAKPTFTASRSTAPVNTPITFTLKLPTSGSQPVPYTFVYGDGATQPVFTVPVYGATGYSATASASHAYTKPGTFKVLASSGGVAESAVFSVTVTITGPAPSTLPSSLPSIAPSTSPKPLATAAPTARPRPASTKSPSPTAAPATASPVIPKASPTPVPVTTGPTPAATATPHATTAPISEQVPKAGYVRPDAITVSWPDGSRTLSLRSGGAVARPVASVDVARAGTVMVQWIVDGRLYKTSTQIVQSPGRVQFRLEDPLPGSGSHTIVVVPVTAQPTTAELNPLQRIAYSFTSDTGGSTGAYSGPPPHPDYSSAPLVLVPTPPPPKPNPIYLVAPIQGALVPSGSLGTTHAGKGAAHLQAGPIPIVDDSTVFQWQPSNADQYTSYSVTFTRPNGAIIEKFDVKDSKAIQLTADQLAALEAAPHLAGGDDARWFVTGSNPQEKIIAAKSNVGNLTLPSAPKVTAAACSAGQTTLTGGTSLAAQTVGGAVALKGLLDESKSPFAFPTHVVATDGTSELDDTVIDWGDGTSSGLYVAGSATKATPFAIRDFDGNPPSHAYPYEGDFEISVYARSTEPSPPGPAASVTGAAIAPHADARTYPFTIPVQPSAKYVIACMPVHATGDAPLVVRSVRVDAPPPNLHPAQCFAVESTQAHVVFDGIGDVELHWQAASSANGVFRDFSVTRAYLDGASDMLEPGTQHHVQAAASPPLPPSPERVLRVVVNPISIWELPNVPGANSNVLTSNPLAQIGPGKGNVILRTPGDFGGAIGSGPGNTDNNGFLSAPAAARTHASVLRHLPRAYQVASNGVRGLGAPVEIAQASNGSTQEILGKPVLSNSVSYVYGGGSDQCTARFETAEGTFVIEDVQQYYATPSDKNANLISAKGVLNAKLLTTTKAMSTHEFIPGESAIVYDVVVTHANITGTADARTFSDAATLSATPRTKLLRTGYAAIVPGPIVGRNGKTGHLPLPLTVTGSSSMFGLVRPAPTAPQPQWPTMTANLGADGTWTSFIGNVGMPVSLGSPDANPIYPTEALTLHDYNLLVNFGTGTPASDAPYATCAGSPAGGAVNISLGNATVDPTVIAQAANASFGKARFVLNDLGLCGRAAASGTAQHANGSVTLTNYEVSATGADLVASGNADVKVTGLGLDASGPIRVNFIDAPNGAAKSFSTSDGTPASQRPSLTLQLDATHVGKLGSHFALIALTGLQLNDPGQSLVTKSFSAGFTAFDLDAPKVSLVAGHLLDGDSGQGTWTVGLRYTGDSIVATAQGGGQSYSVDQLLTPTHEEFDYTLAVADGTLVETEKTDPVSVAFPKGQPMFTASAATLPLGKPGATTNDSCFDATAALFSGTEASAQFYLHTDTQSGTAFLIAGSFTLADGPELVPGILQLDGGAFGLASNIDPTGLFSKGALSCNGNTIANATVKYGNPAIVNGQVGLKSIGSGAISYAIDAGLTITADPLSASLDAGAWILEDHAFAANDESSAPIVGSLAINNGGVTGQVGTKPGGIFLLHSPQISASGEVGFQFGSGVYRIDGNNLGVTAPVLGSVGGWFYIDSSQGIGAGGSYEFGPYGVDLGIASADVSATIGLGMKIGPSNFLAEASADFEAQVCFLACASVDVGGNIVFQAPQTPTLAVTINTPVGGFTFNA